MRYKNIAATGSGVIAPADGGAILWTVNINTGATSAVLTIKDGVTTAGIPVATIDASSKGSHAYGVLCDEGLYYDLTGGNANVTIGYA